MFNAWAGSIMGICEMRIFRIHRIYKPQFFSKFKKFTNKLDKDKFMLLASRESVLRLYLVNRKI